LAAIAVVIVIAASVGGYMYYQNLQEEARKEEKYQRWVDWSKTLYIGTTYEYAHPDIDVGYGGIERTDAWLRAGKLLFPDPDTAGKYHFYLADSYEMKQNAEGEWYVEYKLKPGMKFLDGTDIDAEAVKYCWERELELYFREANRETGHKHWCETSWKRLEAPDKYTLWQFTPDPSPTFLPHPFAGMHLLQHGYVYSPTSTEEWCKEEDPLEGCINQMGYGPFKLDSYVTGEKVVHVAWEDMPENPYPLPTKPGVDQIITITYADPTSMRMALEAGEIDMTYLKRMSKVDVMDLQDNPDIVVQVLKGVGSGRWIHMNYREEFAPLNDVRVRRAIAFATFPEEIVEKVHFGLAEVADSRVHPWMPYYTPAFQDAYRKFPREERIAKAKELLAEAGYPDGFKIDFWYSGGGLAETYRAEATILQAQMKEIGIELELKMGERGVYRDMRSEGQLGMSFGGWGPDYADPDSDLYSMMDLNGDRYAAYVNYDDADVRELVKRGKDLYNPVGDPPERKEVYEELQRIWAEDAVGVDILFDSNYDAARTWVKGFKVPWHYYFASLWDISKEIPDNLETTEPQI
jgi:peptide/nickel transport system substrate-binding protein